jgi:hypothetical protein
MSSVHHSILLYARPFPISIDQYDSYPFGLRTSLFILVASYFHLIWIGVDCCVMYVQSPFLSTHLDADVSHQATRTCRIKNDVQTIPPTQKSRELRQGCNFKLLYCTDTLPSRLVVKRALWASNPYRSYEQYEVMYRMNKG